MKRVIIFGGCGFLGSWIAKALLKKTYHITIFDLKIQKNLLHSILDKDVEKIKGFVLVLKDSENRLAADLSDLAHHQNPTVLYAFRHFSQTITLASNPWNC